jgi:hypothetical protein
LQGCASRNADARPASPAAIAVDTHTAPPAELLQCPERPEGFPPDSWAVIPEAVRSALIRLAQAFARNATRQERLIEWERPEGCASSSAAR